MTVPEHVADPSDRQPGEELGEEITLPKKGLPWPLKLGVEKDDRLTPLGSTRGCSGQRPLRAAAEC